MFKKNIVFFVFLAVITNHTVFSQSASFDTAYAILPDFRNNGIITYDNGGGYNDDYTKQDRIQMGVLNMFFGLGSLLKGHKSGWVITGFEIAAIGFLYVGLSPSKHTQTESYNNWYTGERETRKNETELNPEAQKAALLIGAGTAAVGIAFGYLFPYLYHKPGAKKITQKSFPVNIDLTADNNGEINGLRICYTVEY